MAKIGEMRRKVDGGDEVTFEGRLQSSRLPLFAVRRDGRSLASGKWQYSVKKRGETVGWMEFAGPEVPSGRDVYEITLDPKTTGFASLLAVETAPDLFDIYAPQREALAA